MKVTVFSYPSCLRCTSSYTRLLNLSAKINEYNVYTEQFTLVFLVFFRDESIKRIVGVKYHYFTNIFRRLFLAYNLLYNRLFLDVYRYLNPNFLARFSATTCTLGRFSSIFVNKLGSVNTCSRIISPLPNNSQSEST